jgi:hypothetical protein
MLRLTMWRGHIGVAAIDGGSPEEVDAAVDMRIPNGCGESVLRASFRLTAG